MTLSFSSGEFVDMKRAIAANPACTDRDGTTRAGRVASSTACCAVEMTFELFGRTSTSSAGVASIASTSSAAEGFIV